MKEIPNPLHFIKIKNFCSVKDKREWEDESHTGRKYLQPDMSDKWISSKIYKELLELNNKKTNSLI